MQVLAASLAQHVDQYDEEKRRFAADIAGRILLSPSEGVDADRSALAFDCQAVLKAAAPQAPAATEAVALVQEAVTSGQIAASSAASATPTTITWPAQAPTRSPSVMPEAGALVERAVPSTETEPQPAAPPGAAAEPPAMAKVSPDPLGVSGSSERQLAAEPLLEAETERSAPRFQPEEPDRQSREGPLATVAELAPAPAFQPAPANPLLDLARQLHGPGAEAEAAREQLSRQGLTSVEIELAFRATHPDMAVRLQLISELPLLNAIDAKPWLLLLSHDEAADVRLAATTLMATTGDPQMLAQWPS